VGYVVKVNDHGVPDPQWLGHNAVIGPDRLVPRTQARVFHTEAEAEAVIDAVRPLLPPGLQFEIEKQ
jgi:hypothetical protein